ncbi:hypothetical protein D3C85_112820 [compost metagenome]
MNKTNFNQTGGFPLKTERLQEMQTAYSVFNALGAVAGNLSIISGCELAGTTIKNGFVFIEGELLEFREAAVTETSTVIIIEEAINRAFEDGSTKQVHTIRYATFGTADTNWPWSGFKRPIETKNIPVDLVAKLESINDKEDKTTIEALIERIEDLETAALTIPKIKIITGTETISSTAGGNKEDDYTKNYVYVYPPSGYGMANLVGFMPSIAQIAFSGDVNLDDTIWCKYRVEYNRVTIICSNSETRAASKVNYMAVWIKY